MLTNEMIDKFLRDVDALGLKFPGVEISKRTGYNKSNVSQFLNKKKPIPEKFIKKFYESFYESDKNVPRATNGHLSEPPAAYGQADPVRAAQSLAECHRLMAESNVIIARVLESKTLIGGVGQEMLANFRAKTDYLHQIIFELGLGKKWKTEDEALNSLSKGFLDYLEASVVMDRPLKTGK